MHPDPLYRPWTVTELPPLVRAGLRPTRKVGGYLHRPRSATFHQTPTGPRIAATMWCGMTTGQVVAPQESLPPDEKALCATCEARAVGAGEPPLAEIARPPLVFTPRADSPRKSPRQR